MMGSYVRTRLLKFGIANLALGIVVSGRPESYLENVQQAELNGLLQDAARIVRGSGDIVALEARYRWPLAGFVDLDLRAGPYVWITKTDVGGQSEQPDEGDRRKAAFSDALKRAAVKFGIGRYLYRLKPQWVDYDPQKKRFVQSPILPVTKKGTAATPAPSSPPSSQPSQPSHARHNSFRQKTLMSSSCGTVGFWTVPTVPFSG